MENEIVSIMENIEKDSEKLKQMFGIKGIEELYEFFKENGYKQSFGEFQKEVVNFMESVGFVPPEHSTLENVSGGSSIKDKLSKATSVGLASLLAFGSPISHAHTSTSPSRSVSSSNSLINSSLVKKLIKLGVPASLLTVGGGSIIATIIWQCMKHRNAKNASQKQPTEPLLSETSIEGLPNSSNPTSVNTSKLDPPPSTTTDSTGNNPQVSEPRSGVDTTSSGEKHDETSSNPATLDSSKEEKKDTSSISPQPKEDIKLTEDEQLVKDVSGKNVELEDTQPAITVDNSSLSDQKTKEEIETPSESLSQQNEVKKETTIQPVTEEDSQTIEQLLLEVDPPQEKNAKTEDDKEDVHETSEQLIEKVLENYSLPFEFIEGNVVKSFGKLNEAEKESLIKLVKKIKDILEKDAYGLGEFVHYEVYKGTVKYHLLKQWVYYICNALDGYLYGEQQQGYFGIYPDFGLYPLILSIVLGEKKTDGGKIKKVKEFVDYLYKNINEYIPNSTFNDLSPNELIEEILHLNDNNPFYSGVSFCRHDLISGVDKFVTFVHLLAKLPELKDGPLKLTFRCNEKVFPFEKTFCNEDILYLKQQFEILKNNEPIGTFSYEFNKHQGTATLKRLTGDNAGIEYTYDFESGNIITHQSAALTDTDVSNVQDKPLSEAETTPQPGDPSEGSSAGGTTVSSSLTESSSNSVELSSKEQISVQQALPLDVKVDTQATENPESTENQNVSSQPLQHPVEKDEVTPPAITVDNPISSDQRAEETATPSESLSQANEVKEGITTQPVIEESSQTNQQPTPNVTTPQKAKPQTSDDQKIQKDVQETDEQLIERIFGKNMVSEFRNLGLYDTKKDLVEFVKVIQEALGSKADNLGTMTYYGNSICSGGVQNTLENWVVYICNALDGYLRGEKYLVFNQINQDNKICVNPVDALNTLILSCGFCSGKNSTERVSEVRKCINYLRTNIEKFSGDKEISPYLLPDEVIDEFRELRDGREFSDRNHCGIFYRTVSDSLRRGLFVHLIARVANTNGDLSRLTFKFGKNDESILSAFIGADFVDVENKFEILKNGESIGTFRYIFNEDQKTATVEGIAGENVAWTYTYDPKDEQLVQRVLGQNLVELFKKMDEQSKSKVIKHIKKIQGELGSDVRDLGSYVNKEIYNELCKKPSVDNWKNYMDTARKEYKKPQLREEVPPKGEDELLIERFAGRKFVNLFRNMKSKYKTEVIAIIKEIAGILGDKTDNLGAFAHSSAYEKLLEKRNLEKWYAYICNSLDGYLRDRQQPSSFDYSGSDAVLNALILSCGLCNDETHEEKIQKVKECIECLKKHIPSYNNNILGLDVIDIFGEAKDTLGVIDTEKFYEKIAPKAYEIGAFVSLINEVLGIENISNLTATYGIVKGGNKYQYKGPLAQAIFNEENSILPKIRQGRYFSLYKDKKKVGEYNCECKVEDEKPVITLVTNGNTYTYRDGSIV